MVKHPATDPHSSFGRWCRAKRHPYAPAWHKHVIPHLPSGLNHLTLEELRLRLYDDFAMVFPFKARQRNQLAVEDAKAKRQPMINDIRREWRHLEDGKVVGSADFVRAIAASHCPYIDLANFEPPPIVEKGAIEPSQNALCALIRVRRTPV